MDNDFDRERGSLGLASPGVTIYLPLSSTLCLAMTDPALIEELFAGARKVRTGFDELKGKTPTRGSPSEWAAFLQQMKEDQDRMDQHIRPFEEGLPSSYNAQIVMRVNSLQMLYAERWIRVFEVRFILADEDACGRSDIKRAAEVGGRVMAIQRIRGSAIEIWRCLDSSAMICRKLYQVGATWLIQ